MPDLGELEDLYYAACAKLKELLQGVDILLTNGFRKVDDTYFAYNNEPLRSLGPISIGAFKQSLLIHESILCSSALRSLLNQGVIEMKSRGINGYDCKASPSDSTTQDDTHPSTHEFSRKSMDVFEYQFEQISGRQTAVEGLQDKTNMSCGMVFGELAEKYRPMTLSTLEENTISRTSTPEAPQALSKEVSTRAYISPYNLNERAKKLNVPGGPEMPCICDPECICAPLCASEPTQNCLCEENGLFVRVTEGMDIDDLDVPDLVRPKRTLSEASDSSAASLASIDGSYSQSPIYSIAYVDRVTPSRDQLRVMHEIGHQIQKQKTQTSRNVAVPDPTSDTASPADDILSMRTRLALYEGKCGLFWQDPLSMPLLRMSDFTQHELQQPFSKQCDHPPKHHSVTERIFKTKTKSIAAHRKPSTSDQPAQGHNTNRGTGKVVKQLNKRSLAGISFTGLRFTRRRDSPGCGL